MIPKALRGELGINGPAELEIAARDGRLELTVADIPARVAERDGLAVIETDGPIEPLTVAQTRAAIDRIRR